MRALLDTHTFLWFATGDRRLPVTVRSLIEDPDVESMVSIVSCWEIAIKHSINRLTLAISLGQLFRDEIEGNGLISLHINRRHLLELSSLPPAHGDPFDRLLVAQAKVDDLALLGTDRALDAYGVRRVW
jgi:PIN domain nuclease of toxin-antitoxin system